MELMRWQECEAKHIRNVSFDPARFESLLETAKARHEFVQSINVNERNVSFVFENYYEVIKELLVALMLKHKMRSSNHQCLISFLYKQYGYASEVNVIKQMNFLRNRLAYYGEQVDQEYFDVNKESFEEIITLLIRLVQDE